MYPIENLPTVYSCLAFRKILMAEKINPIRAKSNPKKINLTLTKQSEARTPTITEIIPEIL